MVGRGIDHNRKGGAFEIEQPKVGPNGEPSASESKNTKSTEDELLAIR